MNEVKLMNRIKELRKQKNMTQKELAKQLQIADSTLSYWEQGRYEPDIDALKQLSSFFQVSIDYILCSDLSEEEESDKDINSVVGEARKLYQVDNNNALPNRGEFKGLSEEEINKLAEYAEFIKSQRNKKLNK